MRSPPISCLYHGHHNSWCFDDSFNTSVASSRRVQNRTSRSLRVFLSAMISALTASLNVGAQAWQIAERWACRWTTVVFIIWSWRRTFSVESAKVAVEVELKGSQQLRGLCSDRHTKWHQVYLRIYRQERSRSIPCRSSRSDDVQQ